MAHAWGRFSRDGIIGIQTNELTLFSYLHRLFCRSDALKQKFHFVSIHHDSMLKPQQSLSPVQENIVTRYTSISKNFDSFLFVILLIEQAALCFVVQATSIWF